MNPFTCRAGMRILNNETQVLEWLFLRYEVTEHENMRSEVDTGHRIQMGITEGC